MMISVVVGCIQRYINDKRGATSIFVHIMQKLLRSIQHERVPAIANTKTLVAVTKGVYPWGPRALHYLFCGRIVDKIYREMIVCFTVQY
jgi:hypothetical protein